VRHTRILLLVHTRFSFQKKWQIELKLLVSFFPLAFVVPFFKQIYNSFWERGERHLLPLADEVMEKDPRPPIVFLRSFNVVGVCTERRGYAIVNQLVGLRARRRELLVGQRSAVCAGGVEPACNLPNGSSSITVFG
jgi:hypothetical protein